MGGGGGVGATKYLGGGYIFQGIFFLGKVLVSAFIVVIYTFLYSVSNRLVVCIIICMGTNCYLDGQNSVNFLQAYGGGSGIREKLMREPFRDRLKI